jgi:Na+/H+-dicarboxylate symporter
MSYWSEQKNITLLFATTLGVVIGYFEIPILIELSQLITEIFVKMFKLISMPILFLSIMSCITKIENINQFKVIGKKTFFYTLFTTTVAALIALIIYLLIDPSNVIPVSNVDDPKHSVDFNYSNYVLKAIPNNIFEPFVEYNLFAVLFIAIISGIAIYNLPIEERQFFHKCADSFFALFMKITDFIIHLLPIAITAFVTTMISNLVSNANLAIILLYLVCIITANLIQGFIILPGLLYYKNISPKQVYKATSPALALAFFSKSSAATLPVSMKYAINNLKIDPQIAKFTLPLCTTINMNACAAFILITILFVLESNGIPLNTNLLIGVLIFSIFAAIGNASVPMGCYFMATSFLVSMKIPLYIMTIILPFYIVLDMLETAINVWSDICVTNIVNKESSFTKDSNTSNELNKMT